MNLVFNSSLPRSGSTLMQNLLAQNSNNYCSPTSDLIELIVQARNSYLNFDGFKSQGMINLKPRIKDLLKGMLYGFYKNEFDQGLTVFDKSRGWMAYIEMVEDILEREIKIVCCVRDIRDICASFEKLYRTNQLTKADAIGDAYFDCQTVDGRIEHLLSDKSVVGLSINRLRDVFDRKIDNRLIVVPYNELIKDPVSVIIQVSTACKSEPFICNPEHVEQKTKEDDTIHKMELHKIRTKVNLEGTSKWEDILPERISNMINERYPFLQQLAGVKNEND